MSLPLRIFIVAGEASGDALGGAILKAVRELSGRPLEIMGIGGAAIREAGLAQSLYPLKDLAVMGLAEVLPKIPYFLRVIRETVAAVEKFNPDMILTVDAPDLSFRIQSALKKRGRVRAPRIHVVAPTVWAWRPERAQKIAKFLDGLICLFPFEPPYFTPYGLKAVGVGHPVIASPIAYADSAPLRHALDLSTDAPVLGVYFGSRESEVDRHGKALVETLNRLSQTHPDLTVIAPTLPEIADPVRALMKDVHLRSHLITDPLVRPVAMRACTAAVAVSGTVGLELAVADVPHVIGYRMNAWTWWLLRRQVRVPYAHLANILLNTPVVPEFLQDDFTPDRMAEALDKLLVNAAARALQHEAFASVRSLIGGDESETPAQKAAKFILGLVP